VLRRAVAGVVVVLATLVVLGPAFLGAPAHLAVVGSPADYGLRYEAIEFAPADRPIRLRAWWMPAATRALVIQNDGDPIVPVADARALAAAMPKAEVWITPAPPADHPLVGEQGAFGMHCQSYKLDPAGYVERVTAFLDGAARELRAP
jgi:pimeloyl-ACP methyl ester carboxylesterase